MDRKSHWENIYNTKTLEEVSWYQLNPKHSLSMISEANLSLEDSIMDIGGGDSFLVDHLLELGYQNLSVLDISEKAIDRAKKRLGKHSQQVHWSVSDVVEFNPDQKYDLWHDRAAFHFLTSESDRMRYKKLVSDSVKKNGHLIIGTFSKEGPTKCSGIEIQQYNIEDLVDFFGSDFKLIQGHYVDHPTPSGSVQNFTFCLFEKL